MNIDTSVINSDYNQDLSSNFWSGIRTYDNIPSYLTRKYDFYSSQPVAGKGVHLEAFYKQPGGMAIGDAVWENQDGEYEYQSNITGELKSPSGPNIIEAWHGKSVPGARKYNYYQAFYPAGYFSPPWGENMTLLRIRGEETTIEEDEEIKNVFVYEYPVTVQSAVLNGGCAKLSIKEYHQQFGILSKSSSLFHTLAGASNGYPSNAQMLIHGPAEICPPELTAPYYFDEYMANNFAGATGVGVGGGFYNDNPVPSSLDLDDYYVLNKEDDTKPTVASTSNKINRSTCPAVTLEGGVSASKMQNSLNLIGSYAQILEGINAGINFLGNEPAAYWHFAFKQNALHMPFNNNFEDNLNPGRQINGTLWSRGLGEGTQVFNAITSSEDWWWNHRQCPETPSFLPWTFGGTIGACPMDYFEVPYYAAIRKFGFYGARFLGRCHELDHEENESLSAAPSATDYNRLLRSAYNEQRYGSFHAGNRGFFLWINYPLYSGGQYFAGLIQDDNFSGAFSNLFNTFEPVYSGKSGFLEMQPQLKQYDDMVVVVKPETGLNGRNPNNISEIDLMTNRAYERFTRAAPNSTSSDAWEEIVERFGHFVASGTGQVDEEFYYILNSGIQQRTRTRYLDNIVNGKPIDLFPLNHITFSFDDPEDYETGAYWGRRSSSIGTNSTLPDNIDRRYFEGAYGSQGVLSGLKETISKLDELNDFNAGVFNNLTCGTELPRGAYYPVSDGEIVGNINGNNQNFSINGWYALGYNEVGKYDGNFSCFTPIFVQNPTSLSSKIGQRPTFRSFAVDYHTLPEDKISPRWSEIRYWGDRLKLLNTDGYLLPHYKLKYKWFRVHKDITGALASGKSYTDYLDTYYFEYSTPDVGAWCCEESLNGESTKDCTVTHPTLNNENVNYYQGLMLKHPIKDDRAFGDDKYVYGCIVSGRYGVRTSELAELNLEDFILFDVAIKNGNAANAGLSISFDGKYYDPVSKTVGDLSVAATENFSSNSTNQYLGFVQDQEAVPENVIQESQPPPNLAYCNGSKYAMNGLIGYRGSTATWYPPHLTDSRGLRSLWGHPKDVGALRQYKIILDQQKGDFFYGQPHLPECVDSKTETLSAKNQGIKVTVKLDGKYEISNWQTNQKAWITDDTKIGIKWEDLTNIGELFPPSFPGIGNNSWANNTLESPNLAIGHSQFSNNLGTIHTLESMEQVNEGSVDGALKSRVKNSLINKTSNEVLFGGCGFNSSSLGRHMGYYVEVYERFYVLCDDIKMKNVRNVSYVSPGMRVDSAAIQYFWLGQPNDIYMTRLPMYGPYAYQWKVAKNNRDRLGNGMSRAFYSYSAGTYYDLMYDLPAVYGLYLKTTKKTSSIPDQKYTKLKLYRQRMFNGFFENPNASIKSVTSTYFGRVGGGFGCNGFGDIRLDCPRYRSEDETPDETEIPAEMMYACDWLDYALYVGASHNLENYYCGETNIKNGQCFDPCMSIRYDQGMMPGGKKLDLFGWNRKIRITNNGKHESTNAKQMNDGYRFRGPQNTPYSQYIKNINTTNDPKYVHDGSLSPCKGGGTDHCNYITATVEVGSSSFVYGQTTTYNKLTSELFKSLSSQVNKVSNDD